MEKSLKFPQGFTLIELTIVVSIISILAAIAIPNFQKFTAKSKQSEAKTMLSLIASLEYDYKLRHGTFLACPLNPPEGQTSWNSSLSAWKELGFEPRGLRYYSYEVTLTLDSFSILAKGNIDSDPAEDLWTLTGKDLTIKNDWNDVSEDIPRTKK